MKKVTHYWNQISLDTKQGLGLCLFLGAIFLLSKLSIIIYNEELLVTLTFFTFVFFIYNYFGNDIKESLDERCLAIQQELERFFVLKKESLIQLLRQHKDVSSLMKSITTLIDFTKQVLNKASQRSLLVLNNLFSHHIKQKLTTLSLSTAPLESEWNRELADYQLPLVLANLEGTPK